MSYEDTSSYTDQMQNALFITDAHKKMHGREMAQMKIECPLARLQLPSHCS